MVFRCVSIQQVYNTAGNVVYNVQFATNGNEFPPGGELKLLALKEHTFKIGEYYKLDLEEEAVS